MPSALCRCKVAPHRPSPPPPSPCRHASTSHPSPSHATLSPPPHICLPLLIAACPPPTPCGHTFPLSPTPHHCVAATRPSPHRVCPPPLAAGCSPPPLAVARLPPAPRPRMFLIAPPPRHCRGTVPERWLPRPQQASRDYTLRDGTRTFYLFLFYFIICHQNFGDNIHHEPLPPIFSDNLPPFCNHISVTICQRNLLPNYVNDNLSQNGH